WERWDGDTQDPTMNSENLLILSGNLDAWFYQSLAGIRPGSAGFKSVLIKPEIVGNLSWAKAHFDSPYGRIVSDWKIAAPGQLALNCTIPPNTTALVHVPLTTLAHATINEGGTPIWNDGSFTGAPGSGITYDGADAKSARFLVGSGTYAFTATGTPVVPPVVVNPIVVDDDSSGAQFTGSWTREATTEATQRFGPSFRYAAAGNGSSKADFRPTLPAAGSYKVYAWWTTHTNRATNTPFTIHGADGSTTVAVNQELSGGTWNLLGTFNFKAGTTGYVTITNAANEYVIADAIKFEPVTLLSSYDSWIQDLYPGSNDPAVIGADADPDHDDVSNLMEFALNGSPKDRASRGFTAPLRAADGSFEFVIAARRGAVFTAGTNGSQTATISDPPILYRVEGSQDLSFQDASVTHVSTANTAPAGTTLPDLTSSAWEYHLFRLTGSTGLPGKGFFRAVIGTP
ncbi:MAG: inverting alpha-L-rhamnosidase, partial [Akkermansiaceae bacterium]|nr:inverting alpha-L-rhamnosidase [Akkermansiaceae bacterium]